VTGEPALKHRDRAVAKVTSSALTLSLRLDGKPVEATTVTSMLMTDRP
jgi:hypothetical protein